MFCIIAVICLLRHLKTWLRVLSKTWPGLVIPQKTLLLYNSGGEARGDAS